MHKIRDLYKNFADTTKDRHYTKNTSFLNMSRNSTTVLYIDKILYKSKK